MNQEASVNWLFIKKARQTCLLMNYQAGFKAGIHQYCPRSIYFDELVVANRLLYSSILLIEKLPDELVSTDRS